MRLFNIGHMLAAALVGAGPLAAIAPAPALDGLGTVRVNRRSRVSGNEPMRTRSKNAPDKRKRKANRLHISRRVKRKHRRAAR